MYFVVICTIFFTIYYVFLTYDHLNLGGYILIFDSSVRMQYLNINCGGEKPKYYLLIIYVQWKSSVQLVVFQ